MGNGFLGPMISLDLTIPAALARMTAETTALPKVGVGNQAAGFVALRYACEAGDVSIGVVEQASSVWGRAII